MLVPLLPLLALWACTPTTAPEAPVHGAQAPSAAPAEPELQVAEPELQVAEPEIEGTESEPAPQAAEPAVIEATAPTQATLPAPSGKAPPPCDGLDAALARAVAGDTTGLELDAEGRVQVTYEFSSAPEQLPSGYVHGTSAMGHGQGWCPPALLCDLAATPGIDRVRTVRRASPKLD